MLRFKFLQVSLEFLWCCLFSLWASHLPSFFVSAQISTVLVFWLLLYDGVV